MESWHSQKLNKYTLLAKFIENKGWAVNLFAIEVGAQGDTRPGRYQFALKDWVLLIKLFKKLLNL